jgi:hypothetical protein
MLSELIINKAKLHAQFISDKVAYIKKNWIPYKLLFLRLYT